MSRPPLPPFTQETAAQKARGAEDGWNTRDPARVALRLFRKQPVAKPGRVPSRALCDRGVFSPANGTRELDYRLIKELWAFHENRIAVRFAYEWHDDSGSWFRSYGNENWEFDADGLIAGAPRQHQRSADPRTGPALSPAARSSSGRSSGLERPSGSEAKAPTLHIRNDIAHMR